MTIPPVKTPLLIRPVNFFEALLFFFSALLVSDCSYPVVFLGHFVLGVFLFYNIFSLLEFSHSRLRVQMAILKLFLFLAFLSLLLLIKKSVLRSNSKGTKSRKNNGGRNAGKVLFLLFHKKGFSWCASPKYVLF